MQSGTPFWQDSTFRVTPRGLEVIGEPNESDWLAFGARLRVIRKGAEWAEVDYLCGFEKRYGSTFDAIAVLGIDLQTAKNERSLFRFEKSRRRDDLSLSHHEAVLAIDDPALQDEFLALAAANKWTRQELRVKVRDRDRKEQPWPEGRYGLILADPPWPISEVTYPTKSIKEIRTLRVSDLTAENCVLYLWVVNEFLEDAFVVLKDWGFDFVSTMCWRKDIPGRGVWARLQHELLLVGTKGSPAPPPPTNRPSSVIDSPRRRHSQKPDELYELIEKHYPNVPKIELFARTARPGWAAWGNERIAA